MTGKQLLLSIKARLNQLDTASNRTVRPEMLLLYLNDVYVKLVRAKYSDNGGQADATAFQFTQLTTDELNYLTKVASLDTSPDSEESPTEFSADLSEIDDYWIHLRSRIKVKYEDTEQWDADPTYKTLDTIGPALSDPFSEPSFSSPVLYWESGKVKFPVSDFEVTKYKITYLRKPAQITNDDTELGIPFEDELIEGTVYRILAAWGDPRVSGDMTVNKVLKSE